MKRFAIALLAASSVVATSCNNDIAGLGPPSNPATETFAASLGVNISQMTRMSNGVYYRDILVGSGAELTDKSDTAWVTYAGYLTNGTLFDSGTNTKFELPGQVVTGFRTGLVGMKVGGRRKIVIPSALGYGGTSVRDANNKILIPRQSTLVFDLDLLNVHTPSTTP
jgi:FKBP-type peptidyl-prolyl cis-trans isomerase FkpA